MHAAPEDQKVMVFGKDGAPAFRPFRPFLREMEEWMVTFAIRIIHPLAGHLALRFAHPAAKASRLHGPGRRIPGVVQKTFGQKTRFVLYM